MINLFIFLKTIILFTTPILMFRVMVIIDRDMNMNFNVIDELFYEKLMI